MGTFRNEATHHGSYLGGARPPGDEKRLVGSGAEGEGEPAPVPVPRGGSRALAGGGRNGWSLANRELVGYPERILLDSVEVASLLGLSRTKVFQMMARAELPVMRIGRCVRVPRSALEEWIAGGTETLGRSGASSARWRRAGWGVGGP